MLHKICIVTGTRAEYGLLYWLLKAVQSDTELQLQIIATGMHLSPEFGSTYRQIEGDGFKIDAKVEMLLSSDTSVGIAKSIGLGVIGFADALEQLKPSLLVLLGDRFEILAAAQAALIAKIPIAHLHGGETTEGAFDEQIRHTLTKLSQWHFVAAEPYRKRVIQLGESPDCVFNFGAPGLDYIQYLDPLDRPTLEAALGIQLKAPLFLVTYHPVTLSDQSPSLAMQELLMALDRFPEATVILSYPNADTGGRILIEQINQWVDVNQHRAKAFASLGHQRYLSLMREADLVIGNSSSGLTEAPVLKKATINLGDRQKGRLRAKSVIDTPERSKDIITAIQKALSNEFQAMLPSVESRYGWGDVSHKIKEQLKVVNIQTQKSFFDIEHSF